MQFSEIKIIILKGTVYNMQGMKPYVRSEKEGEWLQKGKNVAYERKKLRYKFLYDDED